MGSQPDYVFHRESDFVLSPYGYYGFSGVAVRQAVLSVLEAGALVDARVIAHFVDKSIRRTT